MKLSAETKNEIDKFVRTSFKGIADTIADANTVVRKEMPALAKEIVLYEGVIGSLISAFYGLLIVAVAGGISYYVNKFYPDYWGIHIGTVLMAKVGIGLFGFGVYDSVKARFAPRLYLLTYAKNLISSEGSKNES